jgi:hypothetical protein
MQMRERVPDRRSRSRSLRGEKGMGLITVIGIAGVLAILTTTIAVRSVNDLKQVGHQRRWEQAIHAGDAGLDHTLFELSKAASYSNFAGSAPSFGSRAAERKWVLDNAAGLPAVRTNEGEWVALKAGNASERVIYAVGYVPSRAAPDRVRVVRAEYDFPTFKPALAILTDGPLRLHNPEVRGSSGGVHSNEDVHVGGSVTTSGNITATGSLNIDSGGVSSCTPAGEVAGCDPAESTGGRPSLPVPEVHPRENYKLSEYDLCPDGTVRTGPSYSAGDAAANPTKTPCQGELLATATSTQYRAWQRTGTDASAGAKWSLSGSGGSYDGVYYIYRGSAYISGGGKKNGPLNVSIFAESSPYPGTEPHCPHVGGDIEMSGNPTLDSSTLAQPLVLVAGRDLTMRGNPEAGQTNYEGVMMAHEQFRLGGNITVNGAVISDDACNTSGSPVDENEIEGGGTVTYNGDLEISVGMGIRVTHWLEL